MTVLARLMCLFLVAAPEVAVAPVRSTPTLLVTPADALVDAPTSIQASGLEPNQALLVTARVVDGHGHAFTSQARFTADAHGAVDLSTSKASGSYSGIDATGLLWSVEPEASARRGPEALFWLGTEPLRWQFDLVVAGHVLAHAEAVRRVGDPAVRVQAVHEQGLVASVAIPAGEGRHPAILHFGGSEGGLPRDPARVALLASRGYVVLSLAYFSDASLPSSLSAVPLEYFRKALDWLEDQPYVDGSRIGVMSASRGTEAALLLATVFEDVRAVIVMAPSSVVWGGFDPGSRRNTGTSPWTFRGREIAYMTVAPGRCARLGAAGADMFRCALTEYHEAVVRTTIPVERIKAPLLLAAGLDDRIWPSALMARQIEDRRARAGVGASDTALYLPHSGHVLATWLGPPSIDFDRTGGDRVGAIRAFEKAWPAIVHFLHVNLGGAQ